MIGKTESIRLVLMVSMAFMLLASTVTQAGVQGGGYPRLIEVFTTADFPVIPDADPPQPTSSNIDLQVYEMDGTQRIETQLSQGLTADPQQAKKVVLQRFQQLNEKDRTRMQQAAIGLAKAVQYGVDRYPAMVFDGRAVVYGMTDIHQALLRYRQWREGRQP